MPPNHPSIGVAIITHRSKKHLPRCLPPLLASSLHPRVLVVNSSSNDGTVEAAEQLGAETLVIPRKDFNHGATRERARKHLDTDIIVMFTPDAYPESSEVLEKLTAPIRLGQASVSYARQVAHEGADLFEAFPRTFNYTAESHIRGLDDVTKYGIYTFFCSNSCAAYSNRALDAVGGFESVLIGEDTVAVAKLLHQGHKIAYTADAVVRHSHRYTLRQEFQRYFDTGLARQGYRHLLALGGSDAKRGSSYVKGLMRVLLREKPQLLPYAFVQSAAKWLGYKMGCCSVNAPIGIKKSLSGQDFYWT